VREMDRNAAIQVLIGAVMGYVQNEKQVSGIDVSEINEVAIHALAVLGVDPAEMRHAIETATFISTNPEEAPTATEVSPEWMAGDVEDLIIHWPTR
jgi:hypothetical protein